MIKMVKKTCKNMTEEGYCQSTILFNKCKNNNLCGAKDQPPMVIPMKDFKEMSKETYLEGRHWKGRGGLTK